MNARLHVEPAAKKTCLLSTNDEHVVSAGGETRGHLERPGLRLLENPQPRRMQVLKEYSRRDLVVAVVILASLCLQANGLTVPGGFDNCSSWLLSLQTQ